jgi:hypothetical protein
MEKELIDFIETNKIEPFGNNSSSKDNTRVFKTKDAKAVFTKTLGRVAENFSLRNTKDILDFFSSTDNNEEIIKRQIFFRNIEKINKNDFLKQLIVPQPIWSPKYDITVVTSNEKTFIELKKMGCPCKFVTSEEDVRYLEELDIIEVIDAEEVELFLEQLPQTIFVKRIDDVYLERYLELLSGWKKNIEILKLNKQFLSQKLIGLIDLFSNLLELTNEKQQKKITRELIEEKLEEINFNLGEKIKTLNFSGEVLMKMLSGNGLPKELTSAIDEEIEKSAIPEQIFNKGMPLKTDEKELGRFLKEQEANEFLGVSEKIKKHSIELRQVPRKLKELENQLILFDFYAGITKFCENNSEFPEIADSLEIINSRNILINAPQPISFKLSQEQRCSILTGANSGGKTTLLEHIIQVITITQLGLPINEKLKIPLFTDIYYFAKNKGSTNKGAFETLLSQMAKISPGRQTLILADEIESVTEPGVAGKIVCATADYFIKKNCFLIIATHLGAVIQKNLPEHARIDGIEAKGLDEKNELIVDHNPVLGRLANSTPELIIEKMVKTQGSEYIDFIYKNVKNQKE